MADTEQDIEEYEDIPELEPWADTPVNLPNITRFLRQYGYTKYKVQTKGGVMSQKFRDDKMLGCMDIELVIKLDNMQNPPITVLAVKPNTTDHGARHVIEVLYSWDKLYRLILKLRNNEMMCSAFNANHEYLRIIKALHERVVNLENKAGTTLSTQMQFSAIDLLYNDLSNKCVNNNCGWRLVENRRVKIMAVGFTEYGKKFSIEISDDPHDDNPDFLTITAWEYGASWSPDEDEPLELDPKEIRKDRNKAYLKKVYDYLQRKFPGPWRED